MVYKLIVFWYHMLMRHYQGLELMRNCRPTLFDRQRYTSGFLCGWSKKDILMAMAINGHKTYGILWPLDCFSIWFWDILDSVWRSVLVVCRLCDSSGIAGIRRRAALKPCRRALKPGGEILCWKCCEDVVRPVEQNVWRPQMWPCFFYLKHVEHIYIPTCIYTHYTLWLVDMNYIVLMFMI